MASDPISPSSCLLVGICGGSGSGKTTLADLVVGLLAPLSASVLSQDHYYKDSANEPNFDAKTYDFDDPAARDFPLLLAQLTALKEGHGVDVPRYSFLTHARLTETDHMAAHHVIILEGTHVFNDPAIFALLDLSIFVDCQSEVRLLRRLIRDTMERGRDLRGAANQYLNSVHTGYEKWTAPTKNMAALIVDGGKALEPGPNEGPEKAAKIIAEAIKMQWDRRNLGE